MAASVPKRVFLTCNLLDSAGGSIYVPEIGQGPHNAIIAPRAVLLCHTHHQGLQPVVDRGAAPSLALLGAIKLLGREFAVPAENRIGCDNLGDFFQACLPSF